MILIQEHEAYYIAIIASILWQWGKPFICWEEWTDNETLKVVLNFQFPSEVLDALSIEARIRDTEGVLSVSRLVEPSRPPAY